ncbi:Excreted virulence factor EspC, type VII ESX diderm [Lentzea fradiae]|uniref:Excreted virulence factor EspC, type VII ESX diderm n=1 Tax=Lentzea fradiae TaxID=200378 RepID=A0A1G7SM01_9PSEU|nr:type VII secretion target [Lentzea fradiae]SDG24085.1 Excreted virulence factor EspC, type VII ESX diderm [Lentzea fradiae]
MTAGGFNVHTIAMREHAGRLDGVAEQIGVAQQAAAQATISGSTAYGILCSPIMLPLMGSIEAAGHAAIATAKTVVAATSAGVTGMADTYDAVDEAIGGNMHKIIEKLGGGK